MNKYEGQQKILWYIQIAVTIVAVLSNWIRVPFASYYTICMVISVFSILSLSVDVMYLSKKIGQPVEKSYSGTYGLIVIFTILLVLHYFGVVNMGILDEGSKNSLWWVVTPATVLLWKSKFIAFREWTQYPGDEKKDSH